MAPVAAILCGKEPKMGQFMIANLAPKLEVVHVCTSVDTAVSEIPALLKGETSAPASGLGTNTDGSIRTDISLIVIGGGYSQADVDAIKAAADSVKPLPFFWADVSKTVGPGPPTPQVIKQRILESLDAEENGGQWAPGMHRY